MTAHGIRQAACCCRRMIEANYGKWHFIDARGHSTEAEALWLNAITPEAAALAGPKVCSVENF